MFRTRLGRTSRLPAWGICLGAGSAASRTRHLRCLRPRLLQIHISNFQAATLGNRSIIYLFRSVATSTGVTKTMPRTTMRGFRQAPPRGCRGWGHQRLDHQPARLKFAPPRSRASARSKRRPISFLCPASARPLGSVSGRKTPRRRGRPMVLNLSWRPLRSEELTLPSVRCWFTAFKHRRRRHETASSHSCAGFFRSTGPSRTLAIAMLRRRRSRMRVIRSAADGRFMTNQR